MAREEHKVSQVHEKLRCKRELGGWLVVYFLFGLVIAGFPDQSSVLIGSVGSRLGHNVTASSS